MYFYDVEKKRVGFCREYVRKILAKYNCDNPPIDLFLIAKNEGFNVQLLDQPSKFSGILHKGRKAIGLNKHHHINRQRFSLAHEMAHYYLDHPEVQKLQSFDRVSKAEKIYDQEADEFAGEILVPRSLLKKELRQIHTLEEISNKFQVSQSMMTIQILKHGLLNQITKK